MTEYRRQLYDKCPLCDSTNYNVRFVCDCSSHPLYQPCLPEKINWNQCMSCNHIFTDGYFSEEVTQIIQSKSHDYQLFNLNSIEQINIVEQFRRFSSRMIDKVSFYLKKQEGRWLDVGFGNGVLMATCQEFGFEPVGVDSRTQAVDLIRQIGIEVYDIDFLEFHSQTPYSVISFADVLEHMPFPKGAIEKAYDLLIDNGVLLISCPNADSFLWKALTHSKHNPYWGEIEHYHNFGKQRLYSLLGEIGFRPLNYSINERYRFGMEIVATK